MSTVLLSDAEAAACLATRDLTDPAAGPHAMQLVLAAVLDARANVVVRLVLRALDRTLTDDEANVLRDRGYAALHEGPVAE